MTPLHFVNCKDLPVFEQLQLEEALLRIDNRNWCLINQGSPPAIVMGISGKPEQLINLEKVRKAPLPVIKRFSGGGTVIVDEDTLFISFVFQEEVHDFAPFPRPILEWTSTLYRSFLPQLELKENDYTFGNKKCGGNAQYIRKGRWLHHTTFLWDFKEEWMDFLLYPPSAPAYRLGRSHTEFLTPLKPCGLSLEQFKEELKKALSTQFTLEEVSRETLAPLLQMPYRKATTLLSLCEAKEL